MGAETGVVKDLMVHGSELGAVLYRNNTGKLPDANGRWVEFGLCPGSSDIIGPQPVVITQEMVGMTVGVFVAAECKVPEGMTEDEMFAWALSGAMNKAKRHALEQVQFLRVIRANGGKAGITRNREEMAALLRGPFGKA